MDDDFGFVNRRPEAAVVVSPEMKNKHGKLTNGQSGNNRPINGSSGVSESDQLDQLMGTLSVTSDKTALSENTEENNNSLKQAGNEDKMLKHIRTSSASSNSGTAKTPAENLPKSETNTTGPTSSQEKVKSLNVKESTGNTSKNSSASNAMENQVTLPQRFVVKYLGYRETTNLWGIKYTRRPVDEMVTEAKRMLAENNGKTLALLKLEVTESGIVLGPMPQNNNPDFPNGKFAIEAISYGVQDLVYTRVFAMIVVKSSLTSEGEQSPQIRLSDFQKQKTTGGENGESSHFRCHAFVCDSRQTARKLTYSLATAFHKFSQCVAAGKVTFQKPKKFAIDLRSPEDIEADLIDSEA